MHQTFRRPDDAHQKKGEQKQQVAGVRCLFSAYEQELNVCEKTYILLQSNKEFFVHLEEAGNNFYWIMEWNRKMREM